MTHPKSFTATLAAQLILLLALGAPALAAPVCKTIFAAAPQIADVQKEIQNLAKLRLELDAAKTERNSSVVISALESDYQRKESRVIEVVLKSKLMTSRQLVEAIKSSITNLQLDMRKSDETTKKEDQIKKSEQQQVIDVSIIDGRNAVFMPIEAGSFKLILESTDYTKPTHAKRVEKIPTTIQKPFEMMATPVTQTIWKSVADMANSQFGGNLNPDPSWYKGALKPVENITGNEITEWIGSLNQLSSQGAPGLDRIVAGHQPGDKYRLPTEAEWAYVLTKKGTTQKDYFFGDDPGRLTDYAWYSENAASGTHDVAQLQPLEFDGLRIYDMLGNVAEFVAKEPDTSKIRKKLYSSLSAENTYIIRGGNYLASSYFLKSAVWSYVSGKSASNGFRLVREARP